MPYGRVQVAPVTIYPLVEGESRMKVEFRLKELLSRYGQDYHGVIGDLADWAGVNRHTIARAYMELERLQRSKSASHGSQGCGRDGGRGG